MKTNVEILDWNLGNINASKDKDGRKTIDDVFDEATLRHIQQLFSRVIIATVENIIATGKEANVFYNTGHGHLGWTLACYTANMVGELIIGSDT